MKHITNNFEETQQLGEKFAEKLHGGDVLLLFGDLGSGKTTFMQGLAKGLGIQKRIISPTFIIVRRYVIPAKAGIQEDTYGNRSMVTKPVSSKRIPSFVTDTGIDTDQKIPKDWIPDQVRDESIRAMQTLYHIDLYRTQNEDDLLGLGLPEILEEKNAIVAIEWPEKLGRFLPEKRWELHFKTINENKREISIEKLT